MKAASPISFGATKNHHMDSKLPAHCAAARLPRSVFQCSPVIIRPVLTSVVLLVVFAEQLQNRPKTTAAFVVANKRFQACCFKTSYAFLIQMPGSDHSRQTCVPL